MTWILSILLFMGFIFSLFVVMFRYHLNVSFTIVWIALILTIIFVDLQTAVIIFYALYIPFYFFKDILPKIRYKRQLREIEQK